MHTYYNYSYTQQIYLPSEVDTLTGGGAEIEINSIAFQYKLAEEITRRNVRIFLGHTTDSSFASTTSWVPDSTLQQVYFGDITWNNTGTDYWFEIILDTAFTYNGVDNLVLAVFDSTRTYTNSSNKFGFIKNTGDYKALYKYQDSPVMEPKNLGIKLYPITWLNWDYVQDSYHGQAMVTSLIPNQVFINKAWAMSMLSIMRTAYPKYVYNKSLIPKMDNRIGSAIGIAGGDMNNVIKVIDPPTISPQVSQFLQLAVEESEQSLGATSVALGDTRPDNTSAIIALQRAAATPSEMTKQNLYNATEDLARIYFEFMGEYYGTRYVMVPLTKEERDAFTFAGKKVPTRIPKEFDFNQLKLHPMLLKLDVGASTYYSEIAAMQTLDGLLQRGLITLSQYLERVSDDYVPKRRELLEEAKAKEAMEQQMLMEILFLLLI